VLVAERRDDGAAGERHSVLVERGPLVVSDAGGVQRERGTESPAEVVSLGQLAGVDGEQRPSSGKKRQLELG
jgi:hypothetical protein